MENEKLTGAVTLLVLNLAASSVAYWLLNGYVAGGLVVLALLNAANVRRVAREQHRERNARRPELRPYHARLAADLERLVELKRRQEAE